MLLFKNENYLRSCAHWNLISQLQCLFSQGFELYISTYHGLAKATNVNHIEELVKDFKPIPSVKAEQLAYNHDLAEGTFKVFDSPLLHAYTGRYYYKPIDSILFPAEYTAEQIALVEECIGPDEKITLTLDNYTKGKHAGKDWLKEAKRSHPLFNQLNQHFAGLFVSNIYPAPKIIRGIIESAPNMQSIRVHSDSDWLHKEEKLHIDLVESLNLKTLMLKGVALSPDFLVNIIKGNPNIEKINLAGSRLSIDELLSVIHQLKPWDLDSLTSLKLGKMDITTDALSRLLTKTENLESLGLRQLKEFDDLMLNIKPGQLTTLKKLTLGNLSI